MTDDSLRPFEVEGMKLLLVRHQEHDWIIPRLCPHQAFPLDKSDLEEGQIRCPMHSFTFSLETGKCTTQGVIADDMRQMAAHREGDWIGVDLNLLADWLY